MKPLKRFSENLFPLSLKCFFSKTQSVVTTEATKTWVVVKRGMEWNNGMEYGMEPGMEYGMECATVDLVKRGMEWIMEYATNLTPKIPQRA